MNNCSLHFRSSRRIYLKIKKKGEGGEEERKRETDRREGGKEGERKRKVVKELERLEQQFADTMKGTGKTWEEALTGEGGRGNIRLQRWE